MEPLITYFCLIAIKLLDMIQDYIKIGIWGLILYFAAVRPIIRAIKGEPKAG